MGVIRHGFRYLAAAATRYTGQAFPIIMITGLIILLSLWFTAEPVTAALQRTPAAHAAEQPAPVRLDDGWLYRWGDSPLGPGGRLVWLDEEVESEDAWQNVDVGMRLSDGDPEHHLVWYRFRLPEKSWTNPALYFSATGGTFEVYVDGTRIYSYGELGWSNEYKYAAVTEHMIPLADDYPGRIMMVRLYARNPDAIVHRWGEQSFWIGSESDLVARLFGESADSTILGFLFIVAGLSSMLLGRFRERAFFPLSFGGFALFIGLFYVFSDPLVLFLIESPALKFYTRFAALLFFPVPLYIFFERIAGPRIVVRSLWISHMVLAVVLLGLDVLNLAPLPLGLKYYYFFFIGSIVVALYLGLKSAIGGNHEARIFIWGFTVLGLTGLHDLLMGLGYLPYWHWLSQWGTLVFTIALAYILERRFTENRRRLRVYSRDLEDKSEQLEEYSRTLEQKVTERTRDLDDKNKDLENTLDELKQTQQHLILSEKMAALGSLVAGVAHEINNPIGAVRSASDVSSRCLDRLQESIEHNDSVEAVLKDKHYKTAMKLLKENTEIALEGSGRVTKIVKSLRNFARLDEAEFQKADIHEGLDSTLTLVHHQLKHRIEVVKEYGDIPKVKCYPNQLNQVFMNLLVNASQAIGDKGTITITTEADDGNVYVTIADDGKGIASENLTKIFDPGFTTKGTGVGTGLGLSISYNIIKNHKGTITAKSEVGRGTTIRIALPI